MISLRGAAVTPTGVVPDAIVTVTGDRIASVRPATDADAAVGER